MGYSAFKRNGLANYAKECRKPKRLLARTDTREEIDEHELEAHYSFMVKIQEVLPEESSSTDQPLEQKANASLTQELEECRTNLDETGRALGEATSCPG
ncbi:hypothetical protein Tco_1500471 [Tanacetum coccineum]